MKNIKLLAGSLALAMILVHSTTTLGAIPLASTTVKTDLSMVEYLESENHSKIFISALEQTDVWHRIQNDRITLFIVTDKALKREGSAFLLAQVLRENENTMRLNELMGLHILLGEPGNEVSSTESRMIKTINNRCFRIDKSGVSIKVGPEAFITKTVDTATGRIHYLDRLLWQRYVGDEGCAVM